MAPLIPSAKATLSYPLYACDFDPLDDTRLVVGGGGGAGRTGVGNKITLLDVSKPTELVDIAELELSKEEDNVTSLAVGGKGSATHVFAGVNSSPKEVEKGKNAHFRTFGIESVEKGKGKKGAVTQGVSTKITELSRAALFEGKEKDAYQRITRISKPYPNQPQLGAVATGLAKKSEIVLFDTSTSPPTSRGAVVSNKEAVDVDFIQTGEKEYLFAYCDQWDIYLKKITPKTSEEEPECIYITPATRGPEKPTVPSFRAMKLLSKDFVIMLANIHSNGGVVLQIFRIPPSGKGQCRLAQSHRLPDRITKATGLAVVNLTPPLTPSEPQGYTQFVIAVAGHDRSISLFKVDLQVQINVNMVSSIKSFRTFKDVHPLPITGLAFSSFTPPTHPITASTQPQTLKLASVGASNTVIVYTLPLFPVPLSVKRGQSSTPRYVVALPSTAAAMGFGIVMSIIGIAFAAIFIQSLLEIRGGAPEYLGIRSRVPGVWQEALGRPYSFPPGYGDEKRTATVTAPVETVIQKVGWAEGVNHHLGVPLDPVAKLTVPIADVFEKISKGEEHGHEGVIVLKPAEGGEGMEAHVVEQGEHGHGKSWEELGEKQKKVWERRLKETGEWADGLGGNLFKGILFSEIAGAVGQAVAGG